MNERRECPQKMLSALRFVLDRVDAQASVSTIADLRNVRQLRTESYALRGHTGRPGSPGAARTRVEHPGSHQAAGNCVAGAVGSTGGQPEQPECGLEVFFVKLPACQNLWFALCRAMEIGPKVAWTDGCTGRPGDISVL